MPIPTTPEIPVICCFDAVGSMPVSTIERNSKAASDARARQREARSQTCCNKTCRTAPPSAGPIKIRRTVAHTTRLCPIAISSAQFPSALKGQTRSGERFLWLVLPGNIPVVARTAIESRSAGALSLPIWTWSVHFLRILLINRFRVGMVENSRGRGSNSCRAAQKGRPDNDDVSSSGPGPESWREHVSLPVPQRLCVSVLLTSLIDLPGLL